MERSHLHKEGGCSCTGRSGAGVTASAARTRLLGQNWTGGPMGTALWQQRDRHAQCVITRRGRGAARAL